MTFIQGAGSVLWHLCARLVNGSSFPKTATVTIYELYKLTWLV